MEELLVCPQVFLRQIAHGFSLERVLAMESG
jgi:hypothetical protein